MRFAATASHAAGCAGLEADTMACDSAPKCRTAWLALRSSDRPNRRPHAKRQLERLYNALILLSSGKLATEHVHNFVAIKMRDEAPDL